MRNRAKCKLCESIIESFHRHDYVTCKCGEISVDGGDSYHKCFARNWDNFLRIDDEGNEIIPTIKDKEDDVKPLYMPKKPNRADILIMLDEMIKTVEKMPTYSMTAAITHYDYYSLLILLSGLFKAED